MIDIFQPAVAMSELKLPNQDIDVLSFCNGNKSQKVAHWASELKLTQVKPSSVALYEALPEIARLKTDVKTRFEMLESLWQPAQRCAQGLAKDFLQQPLILPPSAQKTAILSQALQKHLLDGYCVCVRELSNQKKLKPQNKGILIQSLMRAMLCTDIMFFRCYQLYAQAPTNMWRQLHCLYLVAEYYDVLQERVAATFITEPQVKTVHEAYVHCLALASLRPNQLSQNDIAQTHAVLGNWVKQIALLNANESGSQPLYLVNLSADNGPAHRGRFHCDQYDRVLVMDFNGLADQIGKQTVAGANTLDANETAPQLPAWLQLHISDCWSQAPERLRERKRADVSAEVCVGLIDCHRQICGDVEFEQFLNPKEDDDGDESLLSTNFNSLVNSLSRKKDVDADKPARQSVAKVSIQNASAGGYSILWQGLLGNRVEAGELIGVREQGRRSWSVGVIRWIRKLKAGSQLGVQLISAQPVPYGASFMYDMGGYSDFMRALHIPAPSDPDQPPSLLTASVPFQEQGRVRLKQDDTELDVRLNRCILSTSKVRLFTFETLSSNG